MTWVPCCPDASSKHLSEVAIPYAPFSQRQCLRLGHHCRSPLTGWHTMSQLGWPGPIPRSSHATVHDCFPYNCMPGCPLLSFLCDVSYHRTTVFLGSCILHIFDLAYQKSHTLHTYRNNSSNSRIIPTCVLLHFWPSHAVWSILVSLVSWEAHEGVTPWLHLPYIILLLSLLG